MFDFVRDSSRGGGRRLTARWSITAKAALRAPRKRGVTLSLSRWASQQTRRACGQKGDHLARERLLPREHCRHGSLARSRGRCSTAGWQNSRAHLVHQRPSSPSAALRGVCRVSRSVLGLNAWRRVSVAWGSSNSVRRSWKDARRLDALSRLRSSRRQVASRRRLVRRQLPTSASCRPARHVPLWPARSTSLPGRSSAIQRKASGPQ